MADAKHSHHARDEMVFSYNRVRNALGILGIALPLMLIVGALFTAEGIQPTLSDYYHSTLRDIFVGTLCAMGVFLISYRGYQKAKEEWFSDDIIATIAGLSAIGVAFFPNKPSALSITQEAPEFAFSAIFHTGSALLFYLCMSLFCFIKFTKNAKPTRRRIYKVCGHAIWISGFFIAGFSYLKNNGSPEIRLIVEGWNLIFWVEAIGIWAFAFSWLVKGKADMLIFGRAQSGPDA